MGFSAKFNIGDKSLISLGIANILLWSGIATPILFPIFIYLGIGLGVISFIVFFMYLTNILE